MRERCREDFYPIATTPVPSTDAVDHLGNSTVVVSSPPSSQQQQQQQSNVPPPVLYTVQRVVTTTQIQTGPNYAQNSSVTNVSSSVVRNDGVDCGMQNSPGELFIYTFFHFLVVIFVKYVFSDAVNIECREKTFLLLHFKYADSTENCCMYIEEKTS